MPVKMYMLSFQNQKSHVREKPWNSLNMLVRCCALRIFCTITTFLTEDKLYTH